MRLVFGLLFLCLSVSAQTAVSAPPAGLNYVSALPLRFEQYTENRWVTRGPGYIVGFEGNATTLVVGQHALKLKFVGGAKHLEFSGAKRLAKANYFTKEGYQAGNVYARLEAKEIYPGVGLTYYGNAGHLEYDFNLAAGADPSQIRMRFEGAESLAIDGQGGLQLQLGDASVTQMKPVVHQRRGTSEMVAVTSSYVLNEDGTVGVRLGYYNQDEPLVIDPQITYTAFLGGTGSDLALAIARDPKGAIFIGGQTYSADLPFGPVSYTFLYQSLSRMAFIMKLDPRLSGNDVLQYTTYFGGPGVQSLTGLAVDKNDVIYFTGMTNSVGLPVSTVNLPYQTTLDPNFPHPYVAVIDTTVNGSNGLIYSTFLGGTQAEQVTGIATANGWAYVTGYTASDDFPSAGAYQATRLGGNDAFISILDPQQSGSSSLLYSTYVGGTAADVSRSIAVNSGGQVWITGYTYSHDLSITDGAYLGNYTGAGDAFLICLDPGLNVLIYATYIGGTGFDEAKKLLLLPGGQVGVAGDTLSDDYVVTQNAYQSVLRGLSGNAFLTILDPSKRGSAAIVYSTFFGGSGGEVAYDLRADAAGNFYMSGYTLSSDFPVTNGAINSVADVTGGFNGFVSILKPSALPGSQLVYSSYVTGPGSQIAYGVEIDDIGNVYVTGFTTGNIFPAGAAVHTTGDGNFDPFLLGFKP